MAGNDGVGSVRGNDSGGSASSEDTENKRANDEFHDFITPENLKIPVDFVHFSEYSRYIRNCIPLNVFREYI